MKVTKVQKQNYTWLISLLASAVVAVLLVSCEQEVLPGSVKLMYASPSSYRIALGEVLNPGLVILPQNAPRPSLIWAVEDPNLLTADAASNTLTSSSVRGSVNPVLGTSKVTVSLADRPDVKAQFSVEVYDPDALPILSYFDTRPGSYYRYSGIYHKDGISNSFDFFIVFQEGAAPNTRHALLYPALPGGLSGSDSGHITWSEDRINNLWVVDAATYPWNLTTPVLGQAFTHLLTLPGSSEIPISIPSYSRPGMVGTYTLNSNTRGYNPMFPDRYRMSINVPYGSSVRIFNNYPISHASVNPETELIPGYYEADISESQGLVSWSFTANSDWLLANPLGVSSMVLNLAGYGMGQPMDIPFEIQEGGPPVPQARVAIPDLRSPFSAMADGAGRLHLRLHMVSGYTFRTSIEFWNDVDTSDGINSGDKVTNPWFDLNLFWEDPFPLRILDNWMTLP